MSERAPPVSSNTAISARANIAVADRRQFERTVCIFLPFPLPKRARLRLAATSRAILPALPREINA
ncbi:MAG: hypothetical protein HY874_02965 [Chloroflexi bacterium]|nr:hypothetical protein [Chloroflexota bacterium]